VRAPQPRACALGYNLPSLTGLRKGRPQEEDFVNRFMRHNTSIGEDKVMKPPAGAAQNLQLLNPYLLIK
jgi:hypothetical protein